MSKYPYPSHKKCCECDEPNPCECEEGTPAGILIELGDYFSLSIPFVEGQTSYSDADLEFELDYTESFNNVVKGMKKCDDYKMWADPSDETINNVFLNESRLFWELTWLYIHLKEKVRVAYSFTIDPEKCSISAGSVNIQFISEIYSKENGGVADSGLCASGSVIASFMDGQYYEKLDIDATTSGLPCEYFTRPDIDTQIVTCDWDQEISELDLGEYVGPFCIIVGKLIGGAYPTEPDYDAPEELIGTHVHSSVSFSTPEVEDWCELEEGAIFDDELEDSQNYPVGWGKGIQQICTPVSNTGGELCGAGTLDFSCSNVVFTPSPPDRDGTTFKVSIYYE